MNKFPEKIAVILQPCFFPWRGYFDIISKSDIFIAFDSVQYVKRHWFNRNLIASHNGPLWITVPVKTKNNYFESIQNIQIDNEQSWKQKMLRAIRNSYHKHPFYDEYYPEIESLLGLPWTHLVELSLASIRWGMLKLGLERDFVLSSHLPRFNSTKTDLLIDICGAVNATKYISGPTAKSYISDTTVFTRRGIDFKWMFYDYPAYPQKRPCTEKPLSLIDLLFNVGPEAPQYIWRSEN